VLVDGSFGLKDPRPLDLSTSGTFNLAVLEGFRPELQASGSSVLEVTLRGTSADPRMNGRMEMRNASLRHRDFSNGLSQMNGVLRFSDRQVNIEQLTASSGGGTLQFRGMAEHSQEQWSYRLDTEVEHVRFRYPEAVSSVVDGNLTLSGTNLQSLMSGDILVSRVTISSNLELGTVLANLAEPRQTLPSDPALGNMQLNVRIDSVPDLRIETALVRGATADLDLRLAGAALNPALLGQISMTQGELDFQGTRFHINRGNIAFVNPFRIDPVIDFELETRVRDTDISLTLSGPARKINVTPRSDPPLPFSELITLLALGRTPTTDPVLAARQIVAQQPLTQSGANAVLSQALSQPVNRRLQRFFGVSRLKVDPQSGGAEANPSARISTEQQITNELTFTYSYDLSSAQQQVVRVDWTPTRQWSFIVTRDENGLVGADVLFKKRLR
jgi:translocation and assembly module TamB